MTQKVCKGAAWCLMLPTPNSDVCRLHLKWPLKNSLEEKEDWIRRVNREMAAQEKAAKKQAESDAKLAKRGAR